MLKTKPSTKAPSKCIALQNRAVREAKLMAKNDWMVTSFHWLASSQRFFSYFINDYYWIVCYLFALCVCCLFIIKFKSKVFQFINEQINFFLKYFAINKCNLFFACQVHECLFGSNVSLLLFLHGKSERKKRSPIFFSFPRFLLRALNWTPIIYILVSLECMRCLSYV